MLVRSSRGGIEDALAADPAAHGVLGPSPEPRRWRSCCGRPAAVGGQRLRDERAELYDLEAQGVEPSTLRRELRLRAAILGAAGRSAGVVGAVLSRSVADRR